MNPRTKPTVKAPLSSLAAAPDQTPCSAFTHEFQGLCSIAMDQAIGLEKASLDAVLQMQSCVIDACDVSKYDVSKYDVSKYLAAACFTPALASLFDLMAQALTSFWELQLACLKMMAPQASHKTEFALHLVEPARRAAASVPALAHAAGARTGAQHGHRHRRARGVTALWFSGDWYRESVKSLGAARALSPPADPAS